MLAALYVETDGIYFNDPRIDPYCVKRNAKTYKGPHKVIAHPPCGPWSRLAPINKKRYGHEIGDDDGCFEHALLTVEACGGVLEHPATSYAWARFGLARPELGKWIKTRKGFITKVMQSAYGHKARKATGLYLVGEPFDINWSNPEPLAVVSNLSEGYTSLPRLSPKQAKATPTAFKELLIKLAGG